MLKKFSPALVLAFAFGLVACGDDDSDFSPRPYDDEEESSSSVEESTKISSSSRQDNSSSSAKSSSSAESSRMQCPDIPAGAGSSAPRDTNWVPENVDAGSVYDSEAHTLKDLRDGQVYKTVTMGRQVWMAENLNYAYLRPTANLDSTSICPCNIPDSCARYGRYYTMKATKDKYSVFGETKTGYAYYDYDTQFPAGFLRGVCPKGWHVPTINELGRLFKFVGNEAGRFLSKESPKATDDYGFTLLTSGRIESPQKAVVTDDETVFFWLAQEVDYVLDVGDNDVGRGILGMGMSSSYDLDNFFTLRCLMDPVVADTAEFVEASTVVRDSMTDLRDGQVYPTVKIGTQRWMAKNLNYAYGDDARGLSFCYGEKADSCAKCGRLYTWAAAMDSAALFSDDGKGCGKGGVCNADGSRKVRGVCPEGWHLPSVDEWRTFDFALGHDYDAAKDSTWKAYYPSDRDGTNAYGFSALPAGRMYKSSFAGGGSYTLWWAAEDDGPYSANVWYIEGSKMHVEAKPKYETAYYVRCVED